MVISEFPYSCGCVCLLLLALWRLLRYCDGSRTLGTWVCPSPPFPGCSILITGAGTGIGQISCKRISQEGWIVYGGVLNSHEADTLKQACSGDVRPVLLDVTKEEEISRAVLEIGQGDSVLVAVVTMAMCTRGMGPIEHASMSHLYETLNVGLLGAVRTMQAFLPVLRESARKARGRGVPIVPRIVFMSSPAAHLAAPMHGTYTAAKAALEGVADVLRRELPKGDVSVSIIQPGMTRTATAARWCEELGNHWTAHSRYDTLRKRVETQHASLLRGGLSPDSVARAVAHASCCSGPPAHRYRLGVDGIAAPFIAMLPSPISDAILSAALWLAR